MQDNDQLVVFIPRPKRRIVDSPRRAFLAGYILLYLLAEILSAEVLIAEVLLAEVLIAEGGGFEPPPTDSESAVLPLNYPSKR